MHAAMQPEGGTPIPEGDARNKPYFWLAEAERLTRIKSAKIRRWQRYGLFDMPEDGVSFFNLWEAKLVHDIRTRGKIALHRILDGIEYLKRKLHQDRPLLSNKFCSCLGHLYLKREESEPICITEPGRSQTSSHELMKHAMKFFEIDAQGLPEKFYPYLDAEGAPFKGISMRPNYSFGRPVLDGTGIAIEVIAGFYAAGDSFEFLADAYEIPLSPMQAAIECYLKNVKKAA